MSEIRRCVNFGEQPTHSDLALRWVVFCFQVSGSTTTQRQTTFESYI